MTVIAISMGEELKDVKPYAEKKGMKFPVLIDSKGDYVTMFKVRVRPTTIVINKEGIITNVTQGLFSPEAMKRELANALK